MAQIAIIYDQYGWAFERIAFEIAKRDHTNKYLLIPSGVPRSWHDFHNNLPRDLHLVHYMWRLAVGSIDKKGKTLVSTAVYDHLYSTEIDFSRSLLDDIPFYVSSNKLREIYENKMFSGRVIPVCQDGVDHLKFRPATPLGHNSLLRIGWVGNSKWANSNNKGLHEVVYPAVKLAEARGYKIQLLLADASQKKLTHFEMQDFYQRVDVVLCSSLYEGTPNPILEAASCGRAWISTDVGIVPELAGPLQSKFIVSRNPETFCNSIIELVENRELLRQLGLENRESVLHHWTWEKQAKKIVKFLSGIIS